MPDLTPAQVGRLHALAAIAEHAAHLAASRRAAAASVTSPRDLEYLTAYAAACEAVERRARASMEQPHAV
jgi:hypothetical protein